MEDRIDKQMTPAPFGQPSPEAAKKAEEVVQKVGKRMFGDGNNYRFTRQWAEEIAIALTASHEAGRRNGIKESAKLFTDKADDYRVEMNKQKTATGVSGWMREVEMLLGFSNAILSLLRTEGGGAR